MKKKICLLAIASLPLLFSATSYASYNQTAKYHQDGFSLSASLGGVSGESHEYVYNEDGSKLSQLNWKIKPAPIIKGEMNYDLLSWLTLNARGWTTFSKSNGVMDDYDWLDPHRSGWTDWSHHENTQINYANDLDLNVRGWFLKAQNYRLGVAAGYEQTAFSFKAIGGCYQYYSGTLVGCFENVPGIGYQQIYHTPYLGLAGNYTINKFQFGVLLKMSNWVQADDVDNHYLRNITFKEHGVKSKYQSATVDAGYLFTEHMSVFAEASYNHYLNGRASTEIIDNETGEFAYLPNSAGLDNKNYTISLGVKYVF